VVGFMPGCCISGEVVYGTNSIGDWVALNPVSKPCRREKFLTSEMNRRMSNTNGEAV
jgi:hypothetical protein